MVSESESAGLTEFGGLLMARLADLLPVSEWTAPSQVHKDSWLRYGSFYAFRWVNDGSISPGDLYCFLRARFGAPNGPTMALRSPSTENIYQWHFVVGCRDRVVHFISRVDRLEIVPEIDAHPSSDEWAHFITAVKVEFGASGHEIAKVRKALEHWDLFVNPFARLSAIVQHLEERLQGQELPSLPPLPDLTGQSELKKVKEDLQAFSDHVRDLKAAGLAARMIVPVWGESFVNLLLFVLGKAEMKHDRRVFDSTLRQQIDVRVASLHLNCQGFVKPLDRGNDEFKQFHQLMNSRNEILHGNIDPSSLKFGRAHFDRVRYKPQGPVHQIPVFDDEQNLAYRLLEGCLRDIAPEIALAEIAVVRRFVSYVLGHLDPRSRSAMEVVMASEHLGWESARQRVGVLFSSMIPLCMIGSD